MSNRSANYEDLRDELKTGDIVLFSSSSPLSWATKLATMSKWSHVGMIVCLEEYEFVTVWESTTSTGLRDLDTKRLHKGVQLTPLSSRVQGYKGDVAVRRLSGANFGGDRVQGLMRLRKRLRNTPYEQHALELINAALDTPLHESTEDLSSVFCSELVAEAYQELGLLPSGEGQKPSNEYTPVDFSSQRTLSLIQGELTEEVYLKDV